MLIDKSEARELVGERVAEIKESAASFVDFFRHKDSPLMLVLSSIVSEHGRGVLLDSDKLKEEMIKNGTAESDVLKVLLMTKVVGLKKILETEGYAKRTDVDLYIRNAIDGTGFNRNRVLELTEAILGASGSLMQYKYDSNIADSSIKGIAFSFPKGTYDSELKSIESQFIDAISRGNVTLSAELIEKMRALAEAGIPKAKYYLGAYYCKKQEIPRESSKGVELLVEAAEAGESHAAAFLADMYYEDPASIEEVEKAYDYYTGFGSIALSDTRKEKVMQLLGFKEYGKKIILGSFILIVLMTLFVIMAPGSGLYPPRRGLGIFLSILSLSVIVLGVFTNRKNKFKSLYWMPVAIMALYSIYFMVRII